MRKLMKHRVLWAACLSAALISGMCIYRTVFRGVGGGPELAQSTGDPVRRTNSSTAVREVAGVEDAAATSAAAAAAKAAKAEAAAEAEAAAVAVATSAPSDSWVGENEGLRAVPPPPMDGVMETARSVFAEISTEILAKWGPEYEDKLFSGGMAFSDGGRVVEDKILRAVVEQGDFLAAFTGISITAGHDCLFEQSYPVLFNATMSRMMATAGVRFEAINVAMGNSRSSPYSFCVDAHAGIEADIVSWEMSLELTGHACGPAAQAIELFLRSATVLPKRPAVLVMDAMPDQDMCDEHRFSIVRRRNEGFMGHCGSEPEPEKDLMQVYREFGLHQFFPSTLVPTYTCGDARFARSLLYGSGKHFPRPMSWHPAPEGHALVADMLFMHYAKVFFNVLDRLEEATPGWTVTQLLELSSPSRASLGVSLGLWGEEDRPQASTGTIGAGGDRHSGSFMGGGRGSVLPRPVWCKGWRFCEGAGNYRCANTYFPLAGRNGSRLVDMVSARTPVLNSGHESILKAPNKGHWAVTLNEVKAPILEYLKTTPPEGMHLPVDMKWVLVGDAKSGPIEFEFETIGVVPATAAGGGGAASVVEIENNGNGDGESSAGDTPKATEAGRDPRVVVCRPDFIDRIGWQNKAGVRYSIDGVETSPVGLVSQYGLHEGSCVLLAAEIAPGRHTLAVEPLKTGKPFVAISHVLYPA